MTARSRRGGKEPSDVPHPPSTIVLRPPCTPEEADIRRRLARLLAAGAVRAARQNPPTTDTEGQDHG